MLGAVSQQATGWPHRGGSSKRTYRDYTVGWICALPVEMAAAGGMLDERHPLLPALRHYDNNYLLGSIGEHLISLITISSHSMGGLMFGGDGL
jgi:hypothetical protein